MHLANLQGKKVIVGITGGIAAYKSLLLIRLLIRSGAEVQVIMTQAATDFITPLSAGTLSKKAVISAFKSDNDESVWHNHVEWGLWADVLIIAPATANTIAKMATGQCDNILLAIYLSARCPVLVAPAMDVDMWNHPATQRNISKLEKDKVTIIPVQQGDLASGLTGPGRVAEPEDLLAAIEQALTSRIAVIPDLNILITAGPTYESLDPVRYVGNWSTGKMGIALAEQFYLHGARVTLVQGPGHLKVRFPEINTIRVQTAEEMYNACQQAWPDCQVGVFAAAVADYKPDKVHNEKISKKEEDMMLPMKRTHDIAGILGGKKRDNQMMIGFAMETRNEIKNAERKLNKKNLDLIVLNSLKEEGSGFGTDTNKVTFISKNGMLEEKKLKSKMEVAMDIVTYVSNNYPI